MWEILKRSIYSQEREEGFLETSCLDTRQLEQLKLKNIQEKSCYQGKLTGSYLSSLFGMTSALSDLTTPTAQNISKGLDPSDESLLSQVDSLALTSVQQEKGQESKENTLDSGKKWQEWFAKYDQNTCSWKTPQCSLLGDLELFSETWPKSGMMQNGKCSELTMLALPTVGKESGSLRMIPTPTCSDVRTANMKSSQTSDNTMHSVTLARLVEQEPWKMWNTPNCMDALPPRSEEALKKQYMNNREGRSEHSTLREQVVFKKPGELWPTPRAQEPGSTSVGYGRGLAELVEGKEQRVVYPTPRSRDYKDGMSIPPSRVENPGKATLGQKIAMDSKKYPTPSATRRGAHNGKVKGEVDIEKRQRTSASGVSYGATLETVVGSGQLNPDWVEWLMLWPVGWTSLSPITMDWRDWGVDPADNGSIPRVGYNIKDRAKRLKAIGNGQVPLVAATAFLELSEGLL